MARILLAWEMGGYLGHLTNMAGIAEAFHRDGHQVAMVARELGGLQTVLGATTPYTVFQAPLYPSGRVRANRNPASFPEILHYGGYLDPAALRYQVKAWRALYEAYRPDAVMFDYAPTAQLAARSIGAARVTVGQGFLVPPRLEPIPPFNPDAKLTEAQLRETESRLLQVVNQVADSEELPPLRALHQVLEADLELLTTFEDLDPYRGARSEPEYIGPTPADLPGPPPEWRTQRPRVLAYLKAGHPGVEAVLTALRSANCEARIFCADLPERLRDTYQAEHLHISRTPFPLGAAAADCDLLICHGGHGSVAAALLAGTPCLALPMQVEQSLLARRVEALGAGLWASPQATAATLQSRLEHLLSDRAFAVEAARLAERYAGFSPQQAVTTLAERTLALVDEAARPG